MGQNLVDVKQLTRTQAAEILGLRPKTLANWSLLGRGPRWRKLGRGKKSSVRYSMSDIEAYLAGCQTGGEQPRDAA